jgi:hypothetical protein
MKFRIAWVLLSSWMFAATASADPCDSDQSSSSSHDSGSSSDDSYSSSDHGAYGCPYDASDYAPASSGDPDDGYEYDPCDSDSPIVGSSECRRFGDGWDQSAVPPLTFTLGLGARRLAPFEQTLTGGTEHDGNHYPIVFTGDDLESTWVGALELRADVFVTENLYLGATGEVGGAPTSGAVSVEDVWIEARSLFHLGAQAVAGISIPIGDTSLRAEMLGGFRYVDVGFETRREDCINHESLSYFAPVLEPRIALDVFMTSWLSVGAYGGMNLLALGELGAGANVTLHLRSFDAR